MPLIPPHCIQNQNEFNVRGDQNFGAKNSAWFRYSFINSRVTTSGGLPGLPQATQINARDFGGSFVHIFSPSLILQAQFARVTVLDNGTTRFAKSTSDIYSAVGFADSFANGFAGANGSFLIPSPGISGYANGGESIDDTPKATDSNEYAGQRNQDHRQPRAKIRRQLDQQPLCQSSLTDLVGLRSAGHGESTSRNRGGYRRSIIFFPLERA